MTQPDSPVFSLAVLTAAHALMQQLGATLSIEQIERELPAALAHLVGVERVILLLCEDDAGVATMRPAGTYPPAAKAERQQFRLLRFTLYNREHDPLLQAWRRGELWSLTDRGQGTALLPIGETFALRQAESVPLLWNGLLVGGLIVDQPVSDAPITDAAKALLLGLMPVAALILHNAVQHTQTVDKLASMMYELRILRQIDRELNENIRLEHVYDMTLDWALRYTNAHCASLALYDDQTDMLTTVADLGYDQPPRELALIRSQHDGIAGRVARTGRAEVIPDVALDPLYLPLGSGIQSHGSVPVLREDRVIAVISVESRKLNGLSEEQVEFIDKLAARAGVAIDNARLYSRAVHEREKLLAVVNDIGDVVIVIDHDGRVMLINQSAVAALRLDPRGRYIAEDFYHVVETTPLEREFRRVQAVKQAAAVEMMLPNGRVYVASFAPHPQIGWIVVLHDITYLKETDQLKTDLISTVSHDLKQPLSVMRGYIELVQMDHRLDPRANRYLEYTLAAIQGMQNLIDDLLDLAKLEQGLTLDIQPIRADWLIQGCVQGIQPLAIDKAQTIAVALSPDLPPLAGDKPRVQQIFNNLIGNAVKYTPPKGSITIWAQQRDDALVIAISDTGIGISPEDQGRIFDRFYRVRRAETDNVEGTGVGLAIVKRLVDAHQGQIGLESTLGKGTTFYVTLPVFK